MATYRLEAKGGGQPRGEEQLGGLSGLKQGTIRCKVRRAEGNGWECTAGHRARRPGSRWLQGGGHEEGNYSTDSRMGDAAEERSGHI